MGLQFRRRDYAAEKQAHSLPRAPAVTHPLSASPRDDSFDESIEEFSDPLRRANDEEESSSEEVTFSNSQSSGAKEWTSFKKLLMQRFPVSKTLQLSMVSGVYVKGSKEYEKSARDLRSAELDDNQIGEDVVLITQEEYISQLHQLRDEIRRSWLAGDRVTSLRLSVKVAKLLMDTSAVQFYPTLFVLATDIMDMLGDLVWSRIKQKAELSESGSAVCSLTDHFNTDDICFDAKETCNNWFRKIGSVCELLPRIYLELAILRCWSFLHDTHKDTLRRLVLMIRGIGNPLASAYCCLYLVQCAQRLPQFDKGYLITCISDLQLMIMCTISTGRVIRGNQSIDSKFLLTMIEPAVEYIMKCLFKDVKQTDIGNMLVALGKGNNPSPPLQNHSCISIVLHHMLRELPTGYICSNATELLNLIVCTNDCSFDQCLNFKLLGIRLSEKIPEVNGAHLVVDVIAKVLASSTGLYEYVMITDAYLDIILENHLDTYTSVLLDGIFERVQVKKIGENELVTLQLIFLKLISYFSDIEKILELNNFVDILDMIYGSARNTISVHVLITATRNGPIRDPTVIDVLYEIAQALYDSVDFSNMRKNDCQHPGRAITQFVFMVDYQTEFENQLRFLCQCRGAFPDIGELQEMLVHSSNSLAARVMRDESSNTRFVRSCLAFNEVTIPSIPSELRQLNLYLEAAEIAILGGFVSHVDGLMDGAVNCVQNVDLNSGLWMLEAANEIISLMCKLCGISLMVPGSFDKGVYGIPKRLLSFLNSKSWILPGMKIRVLLAVISMFSALAQDRLPYHVSIQEVIGNDQLVFGLSSNYQDMLSLSSDILQFIVDIVLQEPAVAVRGKIALEVCNCVASVFMKSDETLKTCSELVDIARSCLSPDDSFLESSLKFLVTRQFQQ